MLLKCGLQYVSKFGKFTSGHGTGKGQCSFHSQRQAMPKDIQTAIQLHSFHMLARLCSKSFKLCFSSLQLCLALCSPMDCSKPGFPVHRQLPELAQTHVHWVDDAIQPSHPLSSPSPPAFSLSQHQGLFPVSQFFISGGQSIGSFSFIISPSSEYSGLISFRIDWFDLLAVQGTLKSLLQHCSLKASVLWHSAFFIVQLSHLYMTTGKPLLWLYGLLSAE